VSEVRKALAKVRGVKETFVPAEMTTVTVVYDSRAVKTADVEGTLAAIGKPARAPAR
jgi:copper chaperone CopZ